MRTIHIISLCLTVFLSPILIAEETDINTIKDKISSLESKILAAEKENALWRDTQKYLLTAKVHLTNGEVTQASELITIVEHQLEKSISQARSQTDIQQLIPFYLKD